MAEGKWDKIDQLQRRNKSQAISSGKHDGTLLPTADSSGNALAPINEQIETIRHQNLDIIGKFKRNALDRRATLEALRAMHDAQLEGARHALKRAVDVEKQRIDVVANRYIFQITEEYLRNLNEMGLQNIESRMQTLLQLNEVLGRMLDKAQTQDVPESIREATISNILKKYQEFSDKLMEEEFKLKS
jgi:hypothetical protein